MFEKLSDKERCDCVRGELRQSFLGVPLFGVVLSVVHICKAIGVFYDED